MSLDNSELTALCIGSVCFIIFGLLVLSYAEWCRISRRILGVDTIATAKEEVKASTITTKTTSMTNITTTTPTIVRTKSGSSDSMKLAVNEITSKPCSTSVSAAVADCEKDNLLKKVYDVDIKSTLCCLPTSKMFRNNTKHNQQQQKPQKILGIVAFDKSMLLDHQISSLRMNSISDSKGIFSLSEYSSSESPSSSSSSEKSSVVSSLHGNHKSKSLLVSKKERKHCLALHSIGDSESDCIKNMDGNHDEIIRDENIVIDLESVSSDMSEEEVKDIDVPNNITPDCSHPIPSY